jgi:hypothetical protein
MAHPLKVETVLAETPKAILVRLVEGEPREVWIPKSQIDDDSEVYSQRSGEFGGKLLISDWLAREKGLLDEDEDDGERDPDWEDDDPYT